MIKYEIDYEYGVADFYTNERDTARAIAMFKICASCCFGIRKSLGEISVRRIYTDVELPIPYRGKGATHLLSHHGDEILFNAAYKTHDGDPWKLFNEHKEWCSCKKMGKEELSCDVHHFWVKNHDKVCDCQKK